MTSSDTPTRSQLHTPRAPSGSEPYDRFAPGTVLAERYQIIDRLGAGGMGEVYRADDLRVRQRVALKFLPAAVARDPARLVRFGDEIRAARQVTHPNVCRVHDIVEADGEHFLTMELIDGEDLASLLRRIGRLPKDKGIELARQMAGGLAAVHARGLVHRDLKPANVMIDGRGQARLTDFGLAVVEAEVQRADLAGTPAYMAPEQLSGAAPSVRTDLYALGLVLYEVFTGRRVFSAESVLDRLEQRRDTAPTPPSRVVPDVDPLVERVILQCLAPDPSIRPASALAVLAALPGGDPLAALVAAGETPSPQMVADAGGSGALKPAVAWAWFAALLVLVPLGLWMVSRVSILGYGILDKPPAVLTERAYQVLAALGHEAPVVDAAIAFDYRIDVRQSLSHDSSPERLRAVSEARPPLVEFLMRVASETLEPIGAMAFVSPSDPAPLLRGDATVWLDPHGRLLHYVAVPSPWTRGPRMPMDWTRVIAETRWPTNRLRGAEPLAHPPVFATSRAAWTIDGVRLEAAELDGRLVWLRTFGAWETASDTRIERPPSGTALAQAAFDLLMLALPAALAYVNWRRGRVDTTGATRIASVVVAGFALGFWLLAKHGGELAWEMTVLERAVGLSLYYGVMFWLGYVAIEPFVRRHWPDVLISWSRLVDRRFRDPRVGRDVLVGLVAGWAATLVVAADGLASGRTQFPRIWPVASPVFGLSEMAMLFSNQFLNVTNVVCLLVLLQCLTRRLWITGAVTVGLLVYLWGVLLAGQVGWLGLAVFGLVLAAVVALVIRQGALTVMVMLLPLSIGIAAPLTIDIWNWFGTCTQIAVAATAALGIYGLVVSVGRRSLVGEGTLGQ